MKVWLIYIFGTFAVCSFIVWPFAALFFAHHLAESKAEPSYRVLGGSENQVAFQDPKNIYSSTGGLDLNSASELELRQTEKSGIHDIRQYLRLAQAFYVMKNSFQAMEILSIGVNENPQAINLWMMIGKLEIEAGRANEALAVFRRVISIDQNYAEAYDKIAYLLSENSKKPPALELARESAQKAVTLAPQNPYYLDTLAQVYYKLKDRKKTIFFIDKALALSPSDEYLQKQKAFFLREFALLK